MASPQAVRKWLADQRDVLKTAADAAGVVAAPEMARILERAAGNVRAAG